MSYVDLKHLLAGLALDALARPEQAGWAAVAAACAGGLDPAEPSAPWGTIRRDATALAAPFGWKIDERDLGYLVDRGLLLRHGDSVAVPRRFVVHLAYFKQQAPRLLGVLEELRSPGSPAVGEDIRRGAALLNGRLYFECHEYLEGVWKATSGREKAFFHGIVQVAAAFYHFEKSNWHGARTLLRKGQQKLSQYPGSFLGVDLERFRRVLEPWARYFADPGEGARPKDDPRLNFVRPQKRQEAPRG